jgi:hypothetical protein
MRQPEGELRERNSSIKLRTEGVNAFVARRDLSAMFHCAKKENLRIFRSCAAFLITCNRPWPLDRRYTVTWNICDVARHSPQIQVQAALLPYGHRKALADERIANPQILTIENYVIDDIQPAAESVKNRIQNAVIMAP